MSDVSFFVLMVISEKLECLLAYQNSSRTMKTTTSASGAWSTIVLGMRHVLSTCPSCDRYLSLSKMFQDKICNYFLMISIAVIDTNVACVFAEMLMLFWICYDLVSRKWKNFKNLSAVLLHRTLTMYRPWVHSISYGETSISYTSWSTNIIASNKCAQRDVFGINCRTHFFSFHVKDSVRWFHLIFEAYILPVQTWKASFTISPFRVFR